jgi:hypothetical protein
LQHVSSQSISKTLKENSSSRTRDQAGLKRATAFRARCLVPPEMRGHTFPVDLSAPSSFGAPIEPFRLEYILRYESVIYEATLLPGRFAR